jgi:hypothetical protein
MLATEDPRNTRGQPAQSFAFGVDEPPTALDMFGFGSVSFHSLSAQKSATEQRRIVKPFRGVNGGKNKYFHGFSTERAGVLVRLPTAF